MIEYDNVKTKDDYEKIIAGLSDVKGFFDYENVEYYIDGRNSKSFQETLDILNTDDMYPGLLGEYLVVAKDIEDWRNDSKQVSSDKFELKGGIDNTFTEVAKRKAIDSDCTYLIVGELQVPGQMPTVHLNDEGINLDVLSCTLQDIFVWFHDNRRPVRIYKPNDEKHGKDGKGARKSQKGNSVSVMLCKTDKEAQWLLDWCIGKEFRSKKLFTFDYKRGKYMQFQRGSDMTEYGNSPIYHGFHIDERQFRPKELVLKKKIDEINWKTIGTLLP